MFWMRIKNKKKKKKEQQQQNGTKRRTLNDTEHNKRVNIEKKRREKKKERRKHALQTKNNPRCVCVKKIIYKSHQISQDFYVYMEKERERE